MSELLCLRPIQLQPIIQLLPASLEEGAELIAKPLLSLNSLILNRLILNSLILSSLNLLASRQDLIVPQALNL